MEDLGDALDSSSPLGIEDSATNLFIFITLLLRLFSKQPTRFPDVLFKHVPLHLGVG